MRANGFVVVACDDHFGHERGQLISDPEWISECGRLGWAIITADKRIEVVHHAAVRAALVAVVMLSNNNDKPELWAASIKRCKERILKEISARKKSFILRVGRHGDVVSIRMLPRGSHKKHIC